MANGRDDREGGFDVFSVLPARRPDGNYTPQEVAFVTEQLRRGTLTPVDAASFYGVSVDAVNSALAQQGIRPPATGIATVNPNVSSQSTAGSTLNPLQQAKNLLDAGQQVPEALQRQVFQFAAANNQTAADLEAFFGVEAGTAANTVQALGIADSVPVSLGGTSGANQTNQTPQGSQQGSQQGSAGSTTVSSGTSSGVGGDVTTTVPAGQTLAATNVPVSTPTGAQTTIQREAPEIEARKLGIIDLAKELASKPPAGGLPRFQVADLADDELAAFDIIRGNVGVASDRAARGLGTLGNVETGLYNLANTRIPVSDATVRTAINRFDPFIDRGTGLINQAQRRAAAAGDVGLASAAGALNRLQGTTAEFDPSATTTFMNPFEQAVVDAALQDITRAGEQRRQGLRAQAIGQGAFGGSRAALAERELDRDIRETQARTAANLRMQGFNQAQANALAAFENARRRGQQAAQLTGALGQQGATGSLNAARTLGDLAGLGGRLGESQARVGLEGANQFGDTTRTLLQAGDLGRQVGINQIEGAGLGQDILFKEVAGLEQTGTAQRAARQRALDAERANRLQDIQEPYGRIGFMSDVLRGAPSTQMAITRDYQQQPSTAAQAIGAFGSLASTAAGLKRADII